MTKRLVSKFGEVELEEHVGSALEELFLGQLHQAMAAGAAIPEPIREFQAVAPERKFSWDFAWAPCRLLVEIQGGTYGNRSAHNSQVGLVRDYTKLNLATLHDWKCLMFSSTMVKSGQALATVERFFRDWKGDR